MKAIGNNVVVTIESVTNGFKVNGQELLIDHSWNPGLHVVTKGVVSSVSDKMIFDLMEWEPTVDIQPGDKVWFQRYESAVALGREIDPFMGEFEKNDSMYGDKIIIPFSSLFCVERDGELIMQNGYVLVEPVDSTEAGILERPSAYQKKELSLGKVYQTGAANKKYDYSVYLDTIGYKQGDLVLFRRYNNTIHKDIHDRELYKIQRRNIVAVHYQES